MSLSPVVAVDHDKCVNCHACISVCPVKYCIDGSGDTVTINHDLCIGCGSCIAACTHDARRPIDDFASFMKAIERRERIVAIVAPAAAASFEDDLPRLIGWLTALGVEAAFDVSFGAELTVKSYLDFIDREAPKTVVAQPCPAIVTYVELYRPELLPYLAPADSPMLHTMRMIREYHPQYRHHKVAVISPCVAKRREFDEVGAGDFNVTILSIRKHLETSHTDLSAFEPVAFSNPAPERAVLFSTPGGLMRTIERERPDVVPAIRKIEGPDHVYHYLDDLPRSIENGTQPALIDCLNCSLGCNAGPGTGNAGLPQDELESRIEKRRAGMEEKLGTAGKPAARARRRMGKVLERYWSPGLYDRTYTDRSKSVRRTMPSNSELASIYARMLKTRPEDHLNCSSCGYGSCEAMAIAIHNGLNKPENCHHYQHLLLTNESQSLATLHARLTQGIATVGAQIAKIEGEVASLNRFVSEQNGAVADSSSAIEELARAITSVSKISSERRGSIQELESLAHGGKKDLHASSGALNETRARVERITELVAIIHEITSRTDLLSMNAAIQAARAGEAGRGFGVVASEIRALADETRSNAANVSQTLSDVDDQLDVTSHVFSDTATVIGRMVREITNVADGMTELLNQTDEMADGNRLILDAVASLRDVSSSVGTIASTIAASVREIGAATDSMVELVGPRD